MATTYNRLLIDVNQTINNIVTAKQNDTASRFLDVSLYSNGVPINLMGHSVKIYFKKPDNGGEVFTEGEVTDATAGRCQFELTTQTLTVYGDLKAEISIWNGNTEVLTTQTFTITVFEMLRSDNTVESTNEFGVLVTLFQSIQNSLDMMNAIKTNFGEAGEKAAEYDASTFWRMLEVLAEKTEEAIQLDVSGKIGENTDTGTTTVFGKINNIGDAISEEIRPISSGLMIPKFTKAIIASGSFTIPKTGTYKIIACGAGGTAGKGGGGCSIDQRDYVEGDVLTLTASGSASAICAARSLSMTANGTTTATGAAASGGNVANYTGGTCSATLSVRNSLGCGAGGSYVYLPGGDGGVIGGDGYPYNGSSTGGAGGIIGGNGGSLSASTVTTNSGGYGGVFGGDGGNQVVQSTSTAVPTMIGGSGGNGGFVGGNGGYGAKSNHGSYPGGSGGNGGNGSVLGGNGGLGGAGVSLPDSHGGVGGRGGMGGLARGQAGGTSALEIGGEGGAGGNAGMLWAVPFKEVKTENWTKGYAIIFIEEV